VKRRTTVAAKFSSGIARPQPVAASLAFRIDALHSPARQILHVLPSLFRRSPRITRSVQRKNRARTRWIDARFFPLRSPGPVTHRKKLPGFCADALVVSSGNIQFLVVGLLDGEIQARGVRGNRSHLRGGKAGPCGGRIGFCLSVNL